MVLERHSRGAGALEQGGLGGGKTWARVLVLIFLTFLSSFLILDFTEGLAFCEEWWSQRGETPGLELLSRGTVKRHPRQVLPP